MNRSLNVVSALLFSVSAAHTLQAQASDQVNLPDASRFNLALGYRYLRANAPPASCGCFNMNGGFASLNVPVHSWLSAAVEVTGGHASNISSLGQDLTLTTYAAGPRLTFTHPRFVPFAQVLLGAAHASDSYFPGDATYRTGATSFAVLAGGGADYNLSHRLSIRLLEAQYLHTSFPNGSSDAQNHLSLGAGVVFHFGKHFSHHTPKAIASRRLPPGPDIIAQAESTEIGGATVEPVLPGAASRTPVSWTAAF